MKPLPPADELVTAGKIVSVYGIKGWVKVISYTEPMDNLPGYKPWYLSGLGEGDKGLERVEPDQDRWQGKGLVVHLRGVDDRDTARQYCQREILVEKRCFPPLADGDFYWHQLEGLMVQTSDGHRLGRIRQMMSSHANDVMIVEPCEGSMDKRERWLPYKAGHYGIQVDLPARRLTIDWDPEF